MKAEKRFTPSVIRKIRAEIEDAEQREVFFVGSWEKSPEDGTSDGPQSSVKTTKCLVTEVSAVARGDSRSVPVLDLHIPAGSVVIHNHPSGGLEPSGADLDVAARLGRDGTGFFIVDNAVAHVYAVSEPVAPRRERALETEKLEELLLPGGSFSELDPQYENRDSQILMLRAVSETLNAHGIGVIEAGTGVGKSFAYLLPAFRWAEQNGERVIVSTATINLQQQIVEKDIPLVRRMLRSEGKAVLVKGRGNYVCLRRLAQSAVEPELFGDDPSTLRSVTEWAARSKDGSRSDLPFVVEDGFWIRVNAESYTCLGLLCTLREDCFVSRARREAAGADLLVVNHHLLFADLALRMNGFGYESTAVLPPFQHVVFDEAHHIEKSATSFFSSAVSPTLLSRFLAQFHRKIKRKTIGLYRILLDRTGFEDLKKTPEMVRSINEAAESLNEIALRRLDTEYTLRLKPGGEKPIELLEGLQVLAIRIGSFIEILRQAAERIEQKDAEDPYAVETRSLAGRIAQMGSACTAFMDIDGKKESIFWLERRDGERRKPEVRAIISPLDISPFMRKSVYEPCKSVVCTSATLSVRASFDFWAERVGLTSEKVHAAGPEKCEKRETRFLSLPSPFPYKKNVLLCVPEDAPGPETEEFVRFLSRLIRDVLFLTEGKGLVLFTSYRMLNQVHAELREEFAARGLTLLRQGEDDRYRLLARFKEEINSSLLATHSFWEGVDAPGESCSVVIICRLPFQVPTDPVIAARMEALDASGRSSFFEYSLPEAVLKFKQGFGRLIRRRSDRGVVLVADSRVLSKSYGRVFLESLPETQVSFKPISRILADIERFFYSDGF